jgi:thiamine-monophosphate kinase
VPLLAAGQALAAVAHAMMDVSDGLLLDAMRMAEASSLGAEIDLETLPLSRAFIAEHSGDEDARLFAATGGDDYALLVALDSQTDPLRLSLPRGTTITRVGSLAAGRSLLSLLSGGRPVPLPERLGFEHQGHQHRGNPSPPVADRS